MNSRNKKVSIIIPAKNESNGLEIILPRLRKNYPDTEIIVVDDGSDDATCSVASENDVTVISHIYSMGNGAAIKTGARNASGEILVFMDGDGQHNPDDIPRLLDKLETGYDMVVGARDVGTHASLFRRFANNLYNRLASFMTGHAIEDLTSGFRVARRDKFKQFLYLLPNGFSYPTTSTMAFFRSGFSVGYIGIEASKRSGKSHIRIVKDGLRFFIIILKIGSLFSPMRLFLPVSFILFVTGMSYYLYTYLSWGRFTNMSAFIFLSSLLVFLMGVLAELVSSLHYKGLERQGHAEKEIL